MYSRDMALRNGGRAGLHGEMDVVAEGWGWRRWPGTMSRVKSRGWEVVKRTRLMPGMLPTAVRSSAKESLPEGSRQEVDVLAEELDLGKAEVAILRASTMTEVEVRERSLPRV